MVSARVVMKLRSRSSSSRRWRSSRVRVTVPPVANLTTRRLGSVFFLVRGSSSSGVRSRAGVTRPELVGMGGLLSGGDGSTRDIRRTAGKEAGPDVRADHMAAFPAAWRVVIVPHTVVAGPAGAEGAAGAVFVVGHG